MTLIKGTAEAAAVLRPHWKEIESWFASENTKYLYLVNREHTTFGRLLKCHLITEIYVEKYLCEELSLPTISRARLSYYQKVMLLPEHGAPSAIIKPGLLLLNTVRNRFAHNLDANVSVDELQSMVDVLVLSRHDARQHGAVEIIESFATLACTWLLVPPPPLKELFANAFRNVSARCIHDTE